MPIGPSIWRATKATQGTTSTTRCWKRIWFVIGAGSSFPSTRCSRRNRSSPRAPPTTASTWRFPGPNGWSSNGALIFPAARVSTLDRCQVLRGAGARRSAVVRRQTSRAPLPGWPDRRGGCADWLERYGLYSRPRAEQRVRFIDQYRSYVINYNLGRTWWRATSTRTGHRHGRLAAGVPSSACCRRHACRPD